MALTFEINGVDRLAYLRDGTLRVDKLAGVEVLTCELWEKTTPGASAYRPALGEVLDVWDGADLVFGGEIVDIDESAIWGPAGTPSATILRLTTRGREALASRIVIGRLSIASGDVLAIANDLFTTYLSPFGVTNIGATSGGPTVPALDINHQALADVLDQLTQLSGYVWRINGALEFALVAPGALTGPAITTANALAANLHVQQSRVTRATRLFYSTGGSGTVTHTESRVGDGTATVFLLNIEPGVIPTEVDENGTIYTLPSATWTYNSTLAAIVRASALGNGVPVSVSYAVDLPAWGRVWDSSTTDSTGVWTASALVDATVSLSEQTDLAQATAWAQAEIAKRIAQPKVVRVSTYTPGYYPLQRVAITLADLGVSGDYLVQAVQVRALDGDTIVYDLECREGDAVGASWLDYFRQRPSATGGGVSVASGTGSSGGTGGTVSTVQRIPLGGSNFRGDNPTDWTDVPNAIPIRFGGAAMAGTWTVRAYRRVIATTSPVTEVEIRLRDLTNAVTLATISGTSATTFTVGTTTFSAPLTEGVALLQYRITGGGGSPAEARIGQCSLERD